jgi:hypothetical protein
MLEQATLSAGQSLADSAETMAFVCLVPAEQPCVLPAEALIVCIDFKGPFNGTVELVASEAFGSMLAANMLGCDPAEPEATSRAIDAMKELMNVTCGDLLSKVVAGQTHGFEMGLPQIRKIDDRAFWQARLQAEPNSAFDAEGHVVGIWLKVESV